MFVLLFYVIREFFFYYIIDIYFHVFNLIEIKSHLQHIKVNKILIFFLKEIKGNQKIKSILKKKIFFFNNRLFPNFFFLF